MLDAWLVALVALLMIFAALLMVALHRIRRIAHVVAATREEARRTRQECEALFPQFHALFALERLLALPKALPLSRGWAGSPDFLLSLAEEVMGRSPQTIMECGSGVSTIVAARCAQLNGRGHVYSLEHEPRYACQTRDRLRAYHLEHWATVLDAPLVDCPEGGKWYSTQCVPSDLRCIDLLVVDGPPGTVGKLARYPALRELRRYLDGTFTVLVDDANRDDEREMIKRWCAEEVGLEEERIAAEKGLVVLRHATAAAA
jgi:hypothetical protein